MANWVLVPGGTPINIDLVQSITTQSNVLILKMFDGSNVTVTYSSPAIASGVANVLSFSATNPSSGSSYWDGVPLIRQITPTTTAANAATTLIVSGVGFDRTAAIAINGTAVPTNFISSVVLMLSYTANLIAAGGPYDVVYTDGMGLTNTLAAAMTFT